MQNREDDSAATNRNRQLEFLVKAKEQHRIPLMVKANVIGMGVGQRTRKGQITDELVLKVYVSRKLPQDLLAENDLIPSTLEFDNTKVAVDVEESDIPVAQNFNLRSRPIIGGSSIGPMNEVSPGIYEVGTLGVCVTLDDNRMYILSNNHVLTLANRLPKGTNIVQPSIVDSERGTAVSVKAARDLVATVSHVIPIDFGTYTVTLYFKDITVTVPLPRPNYVDCALARVRNDFNGANREIHWIGYPATLTYDAVAFLSTTGSGRVLIFPSSVCKMGRTTEFTVGQIVDISWDGYIDYSPQYNNPKGTNRAWFQDQLKIDGGDHPFSQVGDSGSLVLSFPELRPVGLLFAGDDTKNTISYCNPISAVMRALRIPRI